MKTFIRSTTLALFGVAAFSGAAMAQQTDGVTVTATPYVSKVQRTGINAGETTMSLQRRVPYRDLDLRSAAGVQELWRRIDSTANEICDELERQFPDGHEPGRGCVREAVRGTTGQVDGAVSQASLTR